MVDQKNEDNKGFWASLQPKSRLYVVVGGAAALVLLLSSLWTGGENTKDSPVLPSAETSLSPSELAQTERALEERVSKVLGQMAGVGSVDVTITLGASNRFDYAVNSNETKRTTEEKDKTGGTRTTTENSANDQLVVVKESGTNKEKPVIKQENRPNVAGVLVVAQGAADPQVKEEITKAVETLLGIPANKVSVFAKEVKK